MQTQAELDPVFLTTGYVTKEASGPLSVTALTPTHLLLAGFPWQAERVRAQLEAGEPLADVLGKLRSWQKVETRIPLEQVQSVSWIDDDLAVRPLC